jgi:hypothetical protein
LLAIGEGRGNKYEIGKETKMKKGGENDEMGGP